MCCSLTLCVADPIWGVCCSSYRPVLTGTGTGQPGITRGLPVLIPTQNTASTVSTPSHQQQHPSSNSLDMDFSQYSTSFTVLKDSSTFALSSDSDIYEIFIKTTKKYKPVALNIKPVESTLPSQFRIIRNIIGDPLTNSPHLNPHLPPFIPTG